MAPQQVHQSGGVGWDLFYSKLGRASNSNNTVTELSLYLDSSILHMQDESSFDVLAWWKQHENMFPVLATMARDLLNYSNVFCSIRTGF